MVTAFNYVYSNNISEINTTHYYVRFKPRDIFELNLLDSLDLELYDYPLNYHILEDGDYWPEAYIGLGQGEHPWLYTVVEQDFRLPDGIQTEILEPLHIPDDNQILEDEAFFITGNNECDSSDYTALRQQRRQYYIDHPVEPCDIIDLGFCPPGSGGGGHGGTGISSTQKPNGQINFRTYISIPTGRVSATAPLKHIRIVAKRFLKIDKTYTDQFGNFQLSKRFPRKVTIVVKFKSIESQGRHTVRSAHTNFGFWRSMYPMKKNIGTYRGNSLQNLNYNFEKGSSATKTRTRKWVGAVAYNTTQESRFFMSQNNMVQLPDDLRLYLYTNAQQDNVPQFDLIRRSNAPLLNQNRWLLNDIWNYGGSSVIAGIAVLTTIMQAYPLSIAAALVYFIAVPTNPDIYIHYRTTDINSLTASKISITTGQQLALAYINQVEKTSAVSGAGRYPDYINSRGTGMSASTWEEYMPFGTGTGGALYPSTVYRPQLIAIWQSFAQHFGFTIADQIYSTGVSNFELQGKQWVSDATKSSSLKYLEDFDPSITPPQDYFNWIPVGLINDLMDSTPDPISSPVIDNVSGFTYYDIQIAFSNKPATMDEFKSHLKGIKPSQANQIEVLFNSYGY